MNYNSENLTELYSLATGNAATSSDLSRFGEMIWNMDKVINAREGFTRADDTIPDRWFEPFKIGDMEMVLMDYYRQKTLTREDMVKLLDDYYDERGWDIKNGLPTKERLVELGLEDMIQAVPEPV
jgi:aldehyde:ferredoxin oxidoreductase